MTLGLIFLSLWILGLGGALLVDFHHCVRYPFFWSATGIFLVLVAAFSVSDARTSATNAESPD
jgi:hypothetical protein